MILRKIKDQNPYIYITIIKKREIMAVMKVIEILANSEKSWEDATKKAIKQASKSVKGIKSAFVQSQSVVVNNDEVTEFRVNLKVTFEVK